MATANFDGIGTRQETWTQWPVSWSAIWVGALSALSTALILGLIGLAVGAHFLRPEKALTGDLRKDISLVALIFSIGGAFFSFVVGGWVAGKIAGILRSETAMLHGAIVWTLAVPLILALAALGAGGFMGGWYGGLSGNPAWASATTVATAEKAAAGDQAAATSTANDHQQEIARRVARNTALTSLTALLLGLIGSVIGGWMASGEPMTFSYYRTRHLVAGSSRSEPRPMAPNASQGTYINR